MGSAKTPEDVSSDLGLMVIGSFPGHRQHGAVS
jgi:hypothetical protein